jgi:hypothetical protein
MYNNVVIIVVHIKRKYNNIAYLEIYLLIHISYFIKNKFNLYFIKKMVLVYNSGHEKFNTIQ